MGGLLLDQGHTYGGGTATLSKSDLEERARELEIPGRSKMTKDELAEAIASTE